MGRSVWEDCDFRVKSHLFFPPKPGFLPVKWRRSGAKIHSGICQFLKQKITSLTFDVMFCWFQFHDKEMKENKKAVLMAPLGDLF